MHEQQTFEETVRLPDMAVAGCDALHNIRTLESQLSSEELIKHGILEIQV
jgi:hypothetical protein